MHPTIINILEQYKSELANGFSHQLVAKRKKINEQLDEYVCKGYISENQKILVLANLDIYDLLDEFNRAIASARASSSIFATTKLYKDIKDIYLDLENLANINLQDHAGIHDGRIDLCTKIQALSAKPQFFITNSEKVFQEILKNTHDKIKKIEKEIIIIKRNVKTAKDLSSKEIQKTAVPSLSAANDNIKQNSTTPTFLQKILNIFKPKTEKYNQRNTIKAEAKSSCFPFFQSRKSSANVAKAPVDDFTEIKLHEEKPKLPKPNFILAFFTNIFSSKPKTSSEESVLKNTAQKSQLSRN